MNCYGHFLITYMRTEHILISYINSGEKPQIQGVISDRD